MKVLDREFFERDCITLAKELLGKYIIVGEKVGRIVETEAYSEDDPASHSFSGRGFRNAVMFGRAGRAYVYFTYGMYHCFNVVVGAEGKGEAVLIRAVEPVCGVEEMGKNRGFFRSVRDGGIGVWKKDVKDLTNGPAKFCMAFGIDRSWNGTDLLGDGGIVICEGDEERFGVVEARRVGISKGVDRLWRFYVGGNGFVSRK